MRKFKKIYIEITNVCNLKCDFCPETKRKPEFMKLNLFEKILKDINGYSEYIYFHIKGEPLLHPKIDVFLDMAFEEGYKVNITTNGTLINKVRNKLIAKPSLRQLNISLHSFDANESSSTIDNYLDDIFSFVKEARENSNTYIALRLWNLEENKSSTEKNKHILNRLEEFFNLDYKMEEKLISVGGIKLAPNVYLNQASKFNWPEIELEDIENKGFCYGLRDQVGILVDGTVVPCCLDGEGSINLGNIKNNSFDEIIEGPRAKALYDGFSRRDVVEALCKKCDYRRRFNI